MLDDDPQRDPFPRAPSAEVWATLDESARHRVVAALPSGVTEAELSPPEGDAHHAAREGTLDALRRYFGDDPRGIYVGSELTVYYPGAQRFCPDLMVVFGVHPGPREKWVVSAEGKGLDFVLEVHVGGNRKKDAERNRVLYAQVGIPEYFLFDGRRAQLHAWRLDATGERYLPVLAQGGRFHSQQLGLDFKVEGDRLALFHGGQPVLGTGALLDRVQAVLDEVSARRIEDGRRLDEEIQQREAAERRSEALSARLAEEAELRAEEARRRAEAEARLAELERRLAALSPPKSES